MNMNRQNLSKTAMMTAVIGTLLAPTVSPARDIVQRSALIGAQPVNVNVSFNIQMPMDNLDEAAIVKAQKQGRALIYRLARNECEVLLEEIAETCRLTGLSASTQIPQVHHMNPLYINLSGNAQFAISLKAENTE
jgi:hypothetical protein